MALELSDLEYIEDKIIKPVIGKLDELRVTIKEYQDLSTILNNEILDIKRNISAESAIHKTEHDAIWTAIRNLSPEKTGKSMALWLDVLWKFLLVGGVIVTVIRSFSK